MAFIRKQPTLKEAENTETKISEEERKKIENNRAELAEAKKTFAPLPMYTGFVYMYYKSYTAASMGWKLTESYDQKSYEATKDILLGAARGDIIKQEGLANTHVGKQFAKDSTRGPYFQHQGKFLEAYDILATLNKRNNKDKEYKLRGAPNDNLDLPFSDESFFRLMISRFFMTGRYLQGGPLTAYEPLPNLYMAILNKEAGAARYVNSKDRNDPDEGLIESLEEEEKDVIKATSNVIYRFNDGIESFYTSYTNEYSIQSNESKGFDCSLKSLSLSGSPQLEARLLEMTGEMIDELTASSYVDEDKFYDKLCVIVPALYKDTIREKFYKKVGTFPKEVQTKIQKIIDEVWDAEWCKLREKFTKDDFEKEKVRIYGSITELDKARASAASLKYSFEKEKKQNETDLTGQVRQLLPYFDDKEVRQGFFTSEVSFPPSIKKTIGDWFPEGYEEERQTVKRKVVTENSDYLTSLAGKDSAVILKGIEERLPLLQYGEIREPFYKLIKTLSDTLQSQLRSKISERWSDLEFTFTQDEFKTDEQMFQAKSLDYTDPTFKEQFKKLLPFLNDKKVWNEFSAKYFKIPVESRGKVYEQMEEALNEANHSKMLLLRLRVLQDVDNKVPARYRKSFDTIFEVDSKKNSLWKNVGAFLKGFYKIPEFLFTLLEDPAKYYINRLAYLWLEKPQGTGLERSLFTVFAIIPLAGLILELPAREILKRVTSPVRAANEAYDFGKKHGGEAFGLVLWGASYVATIGLGAVIAVFAAPLIAGALTYAGGGAAVTGVKSTLGWLAAGGLNSMEVSAVAATITSLMVWPVVWAFNKIFGRRITTPEHIVKLEKSQAASESSGVHRSSDDLVSETLRNNPPKQPEQTKNLEKLAPVVEEEERLDVAPLLDTEQEPNPTNIYRSLKPGRSNNSE